MDGQHQVNRPEQAPAERLPAEVGELNHKHQMDVSVAEPL